MLISRNAYFWIHWMFYLVLWAFRNFRIFRINLKRLNFNEFCETIALYTHTVKLKKAIGNFSMCFFSSTELYAFFTWIDKQNYSYFIIRHAKLHFSYVSQIQIRIECHAVCVYAVHSRECNKISFNHSKRFEIFDWAIFIRIHT